MEWLLLLVLLQVPESVPAAPLSPAEAAHREALTRYGTGILLSRRDLPVQALKQFEAAAKAEPNSAMALKPLVKAYADLGRYPAAIRTARKVLELEPTDYETAQLLGQILFDGKKLADAITVLKQAADSPTVAKLPAKRFGILRDMIRVCDTAKDWPQQESAVRASLALIADYRNALLSSPFFPDDLELSREQAVLVEKLGHALAGQKKYAEAVSTYTKAGELFRAAQDLTGSARTSWNLSGVLQEQQKYQDALTQLELFLALKPSGSAPYERFADLLRQLDRSAQIAASLERYAQLNPKNETIRWVQVTEMGVDNPAMAARLFRDLADATTDSRFFVKLVQFYAKQKRGGELLDLVDRYSKAARTGRTDKQPGPEPDAKTRQAIDRFRALITAMKAVPGVGELLLIQVNAEDRAMLRRQDDTRELVAWFAEQAGQQGLVEVIYRTSMQGGNSTHFIALKDILEQQRKWEEILHICDRLAAQQGNRPDYNWNYFRAYAYAELGNQSLAIRSIDNAGNTSEMLLVKAHILCAFERYAEALQIVQGIMNQPNVTPELKLNAQLRLTEIYNGQKQYENADRVYRDMLEENPDSVLVMNNYAYNMADQGRNLAEAEVLIRRAIEIDRDERLRAGSPTANRGIYMDSLGWILFRRGKLADAKKVLEQAAQSADGIADPTVWDHLGDVYFRTGDTVEARKAWSKAVELFRNNSQGRQQGRRDEVIRKLRQ